MVDPLERALSENRRLKEAIMALRGRFDAARHERAEQIQEAKSVKDAEIRHLKSTIVELRLQLERRKFSFDDLLEGERTARRDERKDLQGTIAAMRTALEEKAAAGSDPAVLGAHRPPRGAPAGGRR